MITILDAPRTRVQIFIWFPRATPTLILSLFQTSCAAPLLGKWTELFFVSVVVSCDMCVFSSFRLSAGIKSIWLSSHPSIF